MRRLLALSLLISSLACGCVAGLAAPAALAAGSTTASTTPAVAPPSLNLNNATQNAAGVSTPAVETIPATTTTSSSSGLSGLDALIIAIVAVLVLGGIAFWVWYDSRRTAARVGHGAHEEPTYGARAHSGSKTPYKQRKLKPAERKRRKRGRAR